MPAPVRNFGAQTHAAQAAAMRARHIGFGPGFVDEDQARWIKLALMTPPAVAFARHVGAILFAGVQGFF